MLNRLLVIIIILTVTCCAVTSNTPTASVIPVVNAGIIVKRVDNSSYTLSLFIDGKKVDALEAGEIKEYRLSSGQHSVHTYYVPGYLSNILTVNIADDTHTVVIDMVKNDYGRISVYLEGKKNNSALDEAINNSFDIISESLLENNNGSKIKIAIVDIYFGAGSNIDESDYVMNELSVLFVNSKNYTVVERAALDIIRKEAEFQIGGEVDDKDAVLVGKFSGAEVVITGSISGAGAQKRLRLKALDVQTANILAQSSIRL